MPLCGARICCDCIPGLCIVAGPCSMSLRTQVHRFTPRGEKACEMNDQSYQRAKELFEDAIERAPAERAGYLEAACGGDADLRRQVDAWLASNEAAGGFLDSLPGRPANQSPALLDA